MCRLIFLLLLGMLWTVAFSGPLGAEPAISEQVRNYRISGQTALDIRREMNLKGPDGKNGQDFDAHTAWHVDWRYRWSETPAACRITSVTTRVAVTFTLPLWQDYASAGKALRQQWDRYYQALYEHEKGHRDYGVRAAREIEKTILTIASRENCAVLSRDVEAAANAILDRHIYLEKQYDVRTAHGAAADAVFP